MIQLPPMGREERKNKKNKKKLLKDIILSSSVWKFFYFGFLNDFSYWKCVGLMKKFIISMLVNMRLYVGDELVLIAIIFVLFLSILIQIKFKPYSTKDLNFLETMNVTFLTIIFILITLLSTQSSQFILYLSALFILFIYIGFSSFISFLVFRLIISVSFFRRKTY